MARKTCEDNVEESLKWRLEDLDKLLNGAAHQTLGRLEDYALCFDYVAPDTFKDQEVACIHADNVFVPSAQPHPDRRKRFARCHAGEIGGPQTRRMDGPRAALRADIRHAHPELLAHNSQHVINRMRRHALNLPLNAMIPLVVRGPASFEKPA